MPYRVVSCLRQNGQDLLIVGRAVGGTYSHSERSGLIMVFSSHSWPQHRIEVRSSVAYDLIREIVEGIKSNARAD